MAFYGKALRPIAPCNCIECLEQGILTLVVTFSSWYEQYQLGVVVNVFKNTCRWLFYALTFIYCILILSTLGYLAKLLIVGVIKALAPGHDGLGRGVGPEPEGALGQENPPEAGVTHPAETRLRGRLRPSLCLNLSYDWVEKRVNLGESLSVQLKMLFIKARVVICESLHCVPPHHLSLVSSDAEDKIGLQLLESREGRHLISSLAFSRHKYLTLPTYFFDPGAIAPCSAAQTVHGIEYISMFIVVVFRMKSRQMYWRLLTFTKESVESITNV